MALNPAQVRTVAAWRFEDARSLWRTGLPKHMNGAVYLGGLVVDCLLKARLLEKHPYLSGADTSKLPPKDRFRWALIFRSHDLEAMLAELPDVIRRLQSVSPLHASGLDTMLKSACSRWTIHVRYLTKRLDPQEAQDFLEQVEELKRWL